MNRIDRALQPGSGYMVLLGLALTVFFAVMSVTDAGHRHPALLFTLLGLIGTWRHYVVWRRKRAQRGIDLLGTEASSGGRQGPKWAR
ncbi:hypothetical protein GQ464_011670 [Rhodocaloribacter litoris]|uniref:hypothetical protein n=1 Tax=Rhodocaloribacter litoris TaxID=2558931 RepID=UPI0014201E3F|nr:hypothetical protein [Rhodocaloribacter litoris]QXD14117.1 hypothetical protein GQ464_011670 [Rhodocaloribacter litoris]